MTDSALRERAMRDFDGKGRRQPAGKLLIGGELVVGGEELEVEDPSTGQVVATVSAGGKAEIDLAVEAARACFDSRRWRSLSASARGAAMWRLSDLVDRHSEELAMLDVLDNGMPIGFARAITASAVEALRYYAGMCTKLVGEYHDISTPTRELHARVSLEPVGVVGAITPWNGPLAVVMAKIAPAIAAGCSIVVKPAEQTPLSALRLAELIVESNLPAGLVNIVSGMGHRAGAALAEHSDVDKIAFTGSTAVGKRLIAAAAGNMKRLTLELGGKSPVFVFDDADLDRAVPACAMAIFANSGQICFAGSRLYVQRGRFEEVVDKVSRYARDLRLGSGFAPQTQFGPLVSEKQLRRVLQYVEWGVEEGAELICGGTRSGDAGYFMMPTIFSERPGKASRIATEEIFGPVLTAIPFDHPDEVEHLANDTEYGLGAGVFTSSIATAEFAAKRIRAGNIWINGYGVLDKAVAFGGFKQSGWGRENGNLGLAAYQEPKAVYTFA